MNLTPSQKFFFELLKAGLWEQSCRYAFPDRSCLSEIHSLASEQAVLGLISAGIEQAREFIIPKEEVLTLIGITLQIEQQNSAMNAFIAELLSKIKDAGISAVLVKGQGVAQSYIRPLWRMPGDVDLWLDKENYELAKMFVSGIADSEEGEDNYLQHKAFHVGEWEVELHGNIRGRFLRRVDRVLDIIQEEAFLNKRFRIWHNGDVDVCLPSYDDDVLIVFTHLLKHLFIEGIGLRQVCDWCRIIWVGKNSIDEGLLYGRLHAMGMMTEWKVFAALAINWLGMPGDTMPFYQKARKWERKADRLMAFIIETGNFGKSRDNSYFQKCPYLVRKFISFIRHSWDYLRFVLVFPLDSVKLWIEMVATGVKVALKKQY